MNTNDSSSLIPDKDHETTNAMNNNERTKINSNNNENKEEQLNADKNQTEELLNGGDDDFEINENVKNVNALLEISKRKRNSRK